MAFLILFYPGTNKWIVRYVRHWVSCLPFPWYAIRIQANHSIPYILQPYVSLLWALPAGQYDCRVAIFPWAGSLLKVAPQGRDLLATANLWMSPTGLQLKLQLDCTAGNSRAGTALKVWDFLPETKRAFFNQGRQRGLLLATNTW